MKTKLSESVTSLIEALKKDKAYRKTWKANIAMAFKDEFDKTVKQNNTFRVNYEDIHNISNNAAENFLNLLCEDIKK